MTPHQVLLLYLILFLSQFVLDTLLTLLNRAFVLQHRSEVPRRFRLIISENEYRRSASYTLSRTHLSLVSSACGGAFLLVLVLTGLFGRLDGWIGVFSSGYARSIIYVAILFVAFQVVSLPASLYSQFVIEERFEFNHMSLGAFFADRGKALLVSAILGIPLLLLLSWLMHAAGAQWWIYACGILIIFELVLNVLYPVVIAPLFNKFRPLEEGELKRSISELADRLSFPRKGVYVMDGSRRSGHSNAYFTGIGRARRIVLFDTLVSSMSTQQICAVLAHEIGHQKMRHILKHFIMSVLILLAGFFVVHLISASLPVYRAFGFAAASPHALLVIVMLFAGPVMFLFSPLFSSWSRRHEYEADRFSAEATGTAEHLKSALVELSRGNLSNLSPHPLYSFYHYSHPTLAERLTALDRHQASRLASDQAAPTASRPE